MMSIHDDIVTHRYPGVKPFSVTENLLFFGRESDLEALNTLIFIKQAVVLYGKSGYGKSSLINAGIIPKLKENEQWTYFSIRFNNYSEKETGQGFSPSQTVKQRLSELIGPGNDNSLAELLPQEDSFWYWVKQRQLQTDRGKFIIFFDQFEELFTYPKEQILDFSEQLAQLLFTTMPASVKKILADLEDSSPVSDQLHDFLHHKADVKVIFSIRSDRMSLLNNLTDQHPAILQNCYELDAINNGDARKAIIGPAKLPQELGFETAPFSYTDEAINKILKSIANPLDGKVEAATLQIICRYVEETLVKEKGCSLIGEGDLGNITDIFQQYYESVLRKLPQDQKLQAQRLIEDELIDGDRRNPLSAGYIQSKFHLSSALLTQLEQSSLLRKERDAAGRILYEISHDSVVAAINKVAESRRKLEEEEKNLQLQAQIDEQTKRAEILSVAIKTANTRSRIVLVLLVVCLVVAGFAWLAFRRAENEKQNAENEKVRAQTAEKKATDAFDSLQQQKHITQEKDEKVKQGQQELELQRRITNEKEQYGTRLYQYVMDMMAAKKSLANADDILRTSPELVKDAIGTARKLLATRDTLPSAVQKERQQVLMKINRLSAKLK